MIVTSTCVCVYCVQGLRQENGSSGSSGLEDGKGEEGGKGGNKTKQTKKSLLAAAHDVKGGGQMVKRGRGRPRLTEEEKQRRKELRDLGLLKRSHRRTKEGKKL